MEFRILGPLEVEHDRRAVPLGGRKQRAVLAVLLLQPNRVVSVGRLIDAVWDERPPETAQAILQGYVSGLRKAIGAELIITRAPGYVLQTEPAAIDVSRFDALVRSGKEALAAGDAGAASEQLAAALLLWRGEPLEDLDSVGFVEIERARLEEMRVGALEERFDAELALGRHADAIPELQALVREHPLRERLRGELMLALYRSGRQAEALEAYRRGRHLLAEELGLEPAEPLQRLERGILGHDPALGPVAPPPARRPPPAPPPEPPPTPRPAPPARRPWRRIALVAGALVVAGAVAAVAVVLTRGGKTHIAVVPNSIAVIDSRTNRLVDDVPIGKRPLALAVGGRGIWSCRDGGTVVRIDPAQRAVAKTIDVGTECKSVAFGFGSAWVAGGQDGRVVRIDPGLNQVVDEIPLAEGAGSSDPVLFVAAGAGSVWATQGDRLVRIDPRKNGKDAIAGETRIPPAAGLAASAARVWLVTAPGDNRLLAFGTTGEEEHSESLHASGVSPAAIAFSVWLVVYIGFGEVQRHTVLGEVNRLPASGRYPIAVAAGDRAVWAVDTKGTVTRLDEALTSISERIATAPTVRSSIAVGDGDVWVAIQEPR